MTGEGIKIAKDLYSKCAQKNECSADCPLNQPAPRMEEGLTWCDFLDELDSHLSLTARLKK